MVSFNLHFFLLFILRSTHVFCLNDWTEAVDLSASMTLAGRSCVWSQKGINNEWIEIFQLHAWQQIHLKTILGVYLTHYSPQIIISSLLWVYIWSTQYSLDCYWNGTNPNKYPVLTSNTKYQLFIFLYRWWLTQIPVIEEDLYGFCAGSQAKLLY